MMTSLMLSCEASEVDDYENDGADGDGDGDGDDDDDDDATDEHAQFTW